MFLYIMHIYRICAFVTSMFVTKTILTFIFLENDFYKV